MAILTSGPAAVGQRGKVYAKLLGEIYMPSSRVQGSVMHGLAQAGTADSSTFTDGSSLLVV